ncbi:MAG: hypothetical protein LBK82_14940 [Planctomycetaceae bacterium]|jgi:hypothetical protein|nr:hypothetical protein [Planctomycetaceae bacterium]
MSEILENRTIQLSRIAIFSFAPQGAMRNNPPQRGGLNPPRQFRPERAMPIRFALIVAEKLLPTALRWVNMRCP